MTTRNSNACADRELDTEQEGSDAVLVKQETTKSQTATWRVMATTIMSTCMRGES